MPKNCTLFWQKTHFQVKMSKTWWIATCLEGHMLHGVGARSTPPSQNAPKTCLRTTFRGSGVEKLARMSKSKCTQQTTFGISNRGFQTTFWKIICRKTRCGRKDISKSNVKTSRFEPPLEDHIPKKFAIVAGNIGIGVSDTFERSHAEKKYTSLWQGHVFQVKPIFEAPTVHAVAKSKFPNKISKTNHFWKITGQQSLWQEPYFHVNISKT